MLLPLIGRRRSLDQFTPRYNGKPARRLSCTLLLFCRPRTKLYAFATHLAASLAVVGVYLLLVYFVWYPAPYYELEQVIYVVAILAGVDVVIGPLLTLDI